MADFVIGWRDDEKRFSTATIRAELTDRRSGLDLPLEIELIEYEPEGIIELVPDEETTPDIAVYRAELTKAVLGDPAFYRKVAEPVLVTITAHPVAAQTASVVFADSGRISRTCTVAIEAPPAQLHWKVRDLESDAPVNLALEDQVLEIEADGQHTIELDVWLVRYQPQLRSVERDNTVHFTHKTDGTFRPRIFAPHNDSLPWVVARAGSGNRRDKSLWKSNAWLPDPRHVEQVPLAGSIMVKAWESGDILDRPAADLVRLRDGATPIVEIPVPVRLVPVRVSGTRLLPSDPIPANGTSTEVTIRFTRTRTGRLLSGAQVSWELREGEALPGGALEPSGMWLGVEQGGHAKLQYTPPPLSYEPHGDYAQPLRLFSGAGEHRDESAAAPILYVSPRVRARLLGKKPGLDFEPPYELDIAAGESPEELVVHHGFLSLDPTIDIRNDVFDASPEITVVTDRGEVAVAIDGRTDVAGTLVWKLPELVDGLAALPPGPRRRMVLEPFQQESAGDLDDESYRIVRTYRAYLADPQIASTTTRLLDQSLLGALRDQPRQQARQLCLQPREDVDKVRHGTDLVLAATRGTVIADTMHANLFDRALDLAVKFAVDLTDYLIRAYRLGDQLLAWLATTGPVRLLAYLGGGIVKLLRSMLPILSSRLPSLVGLAESVITSAAGSGSAFVRQLSRLVEQTLAMMTTQVNTIFQYAETMAIGLLTPGPVLGEGAFYAAKKLTENRMKAWSKALAQFYVGSGPLHDIVDKLTLGHTTKGDAYRDAKNWIRANLPTGVSGVAADAMGTTIGNVHALVYAFPPDGIPEYFTAMHSLDRRDASFGAALGTLDDAMSSFGTLCDLLAGLAVVGAVVSWGTATPISFAALSALSVLKLQINTSVHLVEAFSLIAFAYFVLGAYRELTVGLTRRIP